MEYQVVSHEDARAATSKAIAIIQAAGLSYDLWENSMWDSKRKVGLPYRSLRLRIYAQSNLPGADVRGILMALKGFKQYVRSDHTAFITHYTPDGKCYVERRQPIDMWVYRLDREKFYADKPAFVNFTEFVADHHASIKEVETHGVQKTWLYPYFVERVAGPYRQGKAIHKKLLALNGG